MKGKKTEAERLFVLGTCTPLAGSLLGFQDNAVMIALLGTSFSWIDIICYAVGCILILSGKVLFSLHISQKRQI